MDHDTATEALLRWRLVLGRHAEQPLPMGSVGDPEDVRRDGALELLYQREHDQRSHRPAGADSGDGLVVPEWLTEIRLVFPEAAVERLEQDALERYGLAELVTDPDVLRRATPSQHLVRAILQFKHRMKGEVLGVAREVVRQAVLALTEALRAECLPALTGPRSEIDVPPRRTFRNVDWRRTIRRNLGRWDTERRRLVVDRVDYRHRQAGSTPWQIVIAVDQSGSMADSLVHATVMASIFAALPSVSVRLAAFDHRVVDLTSLVSDPLAVLMGCQLGGGTRILPALTWCSEQIVDPTRTLIVLISDLESTDPPGPSAELARELHEAGVKGFALAAVDDEGRASLDARFERLLRDAGWWCGSATPKQLAARVAAHIRGS